MSSNGNSLRTSRAGESGKKSAKERVFLLSPANISGRRGQLILGESARCELAARLREGRVALGEIFSFISGLYFRGKLTYAGAFANPPAGTTGVLVITASRGLVAPETLVSLEELREMVASPIDEGAARYREPLERDALLLEKRARGCEVVLLGSVATDKYVEPLAGIFGTRLMFPMEFAGRGDMSRGGLMLRAAREGAELKYVSVATSLRHRPRPPKLAKLAPVREPMTSGAQARMRVKRIAQVAD